MSKYSLLGLLLLTTVFFASCKKEKDKEEPEETNTFTTAQVTFKDKATGDTTVYTYRNLEGLGGDYNSPQDRIIFHEASGSYDYDVSVAFFDETKDPAKDLTPMIQQKSDEYRLYWDFAAIEARNLNVDGFDKDKNGMTLGLKSAWKIGAYGGGLFMLVLRHYPNGGKEETDPIRSDKSTTVADISFLLDIWPYR